MNKNKLEAVMKLHGDTGTTLSQHLGMARGTFSIKLNGTNGAEFTQGEIMKIKSKYDLNSEQLSDIFFTKEVS